MNLRRLCSADTRHRWFSACRAFANAGWFASILTRPLQRIRRGRRNKWPRVMRRDSGYPGIRNELETLSSSIRHLGGRLGASVIKSPG